MFLYQEESGYFFNSDSHFLFDFISKFNPTGALLDIGCGCGILGLLSARDFDIKLTQIDKQPHNCFITQKNAQINHLHTNVIEDDFMTHHFEERFDFIISNPPYYHDGVSKSNNTILHTSRYNIHLPIDMLMQKVRKIIKNYGHFIFCYDAKMIQELLIHLKEAKMQVEDLQFVYGTAAKNASLVLIHARKGSKSKTNIHPPLINMQEGTPTKEVKSIYQKTRTYSIKCKVL
ncbi:MAG: methyltransferase [Epsilonproteobacteria bacterium]|nr:methyltransferase [Campylobacterota bacterium]